MIGALVGALSMPLVPGPAAAPVTPDAARRANTIDVVHPGADVQAPLELRTRGNATPLAARTEARLRRGERRTWLALDDQRGVFYPKDYRLRAKSDHLEIWSASGVDATASGLRFPEGDCRNDLAERIKITKAQIRYFIDEFESNIYKKESRWFSVPPKRNGAGASFHEEIGRPAGYYRGLGRRIVVLIDNIRDENFYDTDNARSLPRFAGFFSSYYLQVFDRNVMTIDSHDWLHRTTATPPDSPDPDDPCINSPARPFQYEGTFAHEYQHLLAYYESPNETSWINEGLSDWAESLTGYATPERSITERGFDSHVQCFLGHLETQTPVNPIPLPQGGAENSLTLWGDQGNAEILCDYGAAFTMMEMLAGRYGKRFMRALHRDDRNGFDSLNALLAEAAPGVTARDVILDWAALVALDGVLDDGAVLTGGDPSRYQAPGLSATIAWDNDDSYSAPGAPPNGSDYVRARDSTGAFLAAGAVDDISFEDLSPAKDFTVQLVAYDRSHTRAWVGKLVLDKLGRGSLAGPELRAVIGPDAKTVAVIVTYFDATESVTGYAPYELRVNGAIQPGGS
jgi:hypothetical protein